MLFQVHTGPIWCHGSSIYEALLEFFSFLFFIIQSELHSCHRQWNISPHTHSQRWHFSVILILYGSHVIAIQSWDENNVSQECPVIERSSWKWQFVFVSMKHLCCFIAALHLHVPSHKHVFCTAVCLSVSSVITYSCSKFTEIQRSDWFWKSGLLI